MPYFQTICLLLITCSTFTSCANSKHKLSTSTNSEEVAIQTEKQSISEKLRAIDHLPVEDRIALYHRLKKESPELYNFENEDELTMYGYSLLWSDKISDAIAIFKLIVEQFPNSSNPYDSLGEGYMANGDMELAILNYEKSLALNPGNFNAEDQIEKIRFPNKVPETAAEQFIKTFTISEYKADLDQLGSKLIEINPSALKFISKTDFWDLIEKKKALITDHTTYSEFRWHCSEIIASINCSHTSMGKFYPENDMLPISLRFPIQTRLIDGKLYVTNSFNNSDKTNIKDEVLSINGIAVSVLIEDIYKHIQSQGFIKTTKNHFFNRWTTTLIPYALNFPKNYIVKIKGKETLVKLDRAQKFNDPVIDYATNVCNNNLCLEIFNKNKTAILSIASFNYYKWNNYAEFEKFIDKSFKEINDKEIENLIVDVRFNGGGSPESSIYLLKYLAQKPFNYFSKTEYPIGKGEHIPFENTFKGNTYYIIDGHGNSTTGHFMSIVKTHQLGTIIGEELGSNQFCTAGQAVCRLSNSKLNYYVANTASWIVVNSLSDDTGILPDHYVTQSIDEYLSKVDAAKEYTIKLIKQN